MKDTTRSAASIYRTKAKYILMAQAKTDAGFYLTIEPVISLAVESSHHLIGSSLLSVLRNYKMGHPTPSRDEYKKVMSHVLAAAGFKSWPQLQRQAANCGVEVSDASIVIEASHYGGESGSQKGYAPHKPVRAITVSATSSEEKIGTAVISAFAMCTVSEQRREI